MKLNFFKIKSKNLITICLIIALTLMCNKNGFACQILGAVINYNGKEIENSISVSNPYSESDLQDKPVYKNPSFLINQRVEDLLSRMTLEEKIGQMNMPCLYISEMGKIISEKTESSKKLTAGTFMENLGPIGGFFTLANNILHEGPRQQATFFNELQKIAIEKTRLGIPLLQTEEGTHGVMCSGGTIFPEGPAIGSSWNTKLVKDIYTVAAKEARSLGIHQLFTLVVEPIRDPRLGRNQEGYSEDPYFCARMAENIVHAVQGNDISANDKTVAGLCHFPVQSEPVSGMERGAMEISERKLREVFLPPWVAGIKKAGALGIMATYPSVDGIPTHASEFLLTDILRNELGFEGWRLVKEAELQLLYMSIWQRIKKKQEPSPSKQVLMLEFHLKRLFCNRCSKM